MSTRIDPTKPVCTKQGLRAVITAVDPDSLSGSIISLDGSTISLTWPLNGEYCGSDHTSWHIINVPDGFEMIDLNRPVETVGARPVRNLEVEFTEQNGVVISAEVDIGGNPPYWSHYTWTSFGRSFNPAFQNGYDASGNPENGGNLRNVPGAAPFKPLIDLDQPVETVTDGWEVEILRYSNPYRIEGYVIPPWGGRERVSWDLHGNPVKIEGEALTDRTKTAYAIRNTPTPEQVEQDRIADFRRIIKSYVEHEQEREFRDSGYGEVQFDKYHDIGFVRRTFDDNQWEVWEINTDFCPFAIIPSIIKGEDVAQFWDWLRLRDNEKFENGRRQGIREGDARRVELIAQAKRALECVEQGLDPDANNYAEEF